MKLYEPFPSAITVDGTEYSLTLYFDRVIRYMDLSESNDLLPDDIISAGYAWLVEAPKRVPLATQMKVIDRIFDEIIVVKRRALSTDKKPQRAFDFSYDAREIYASFMRDYGIDLVEEQGRMHWCKFLALFDGLSDDTPIKRIMDIRTREIPAPTKHNAKEIEQLAKLKTIYALPAKKQDEPEAAKAWDSLFDMLLAKAEQ